MAPRRSWAGRQPVLVETCCGLVSKRAGRGTLLPETRSFDGKFNAVGASSAARGGSAQACGRSTEIAPEKAEKAAEERVVEQAQETSAQSLQRADGQRSGGDSGVLGHAYRSDELEWDGERRVCRSARFVAACVRILARSAGTMRQRNRLAISASSECPGPFKQRS